MEAAERRDAILKKIIDAEEAITGSELAKFFMVSRQIIVQDVAILRAAGENILATSQGYMIPKMTAKKPYVKVFACKHDAGEKLDEELLSIVDLGGKIIDVIVEHPFYGEFRGMLMISSPAGVRKFLEEMRKGSAEPLSSLTGGVHLHTIEATDKDTLDLIEEVLDQKGILLKETM